VKTNQATQDQQQVIDLEGNTIWARLINTG